MLHLPLRIGNTIATDDLGTISIVDSQARPQVVALVPFIPHTDRPFDTEAAARARAEAIVHLINTPSQG